jgi:cell fate (sporulation/competence/biofilm development) regulator YmcA (YheA/YmcA/DUF963 family)
MALTKQNLNLSTKIFVTKIDFDTRIDRLEEKIDDLETRINHLPTKNEFYEAMDKIMGELQTIRDEQALTPSHSDLADLEEKIEVIEKQVLHS